MLPFPLVHREDFYLPFGETHVFPGVKYSRIRQRLLQSGAAREEDFLGCEPIDLADVLRVHEAGYVDRLLNGTLSEMEIRRMELPYSEEIVEATLLGAGGTLLAARLSCSKGVALSIGGGFHHAHPGHGEGFCILHDVAIALRRLQSDRILRSAMVLDLDVHHGNGTAAIFPPYAAGLSDAFAAGRGESSQGNGPEPAKRPLAERLNCGELTGSALPSRENVFTVSLHQRNNYPAYKPPSSIDVHLDDGTGDSEYLAALDRVLHLAFARFRPDLLAYIAGADPFAGDQLGGLALS
ncbi:MAG TPA: histone deacetylase, partial [Acidobacteriaceae bacterium]|nr:histone deacetylase [Acidobacteriaceae bacterium]